MTLGDRLAKLNHLQRTTRFKTIASVLVVATAITVFAVWWTALNAPAGAGSGQSDEPVARETVRSADAPETEAAGGDGAEQDLLAQREASEDFRPRLDAKAVLDAVGSRDATAGVAIGTVVATGVALLVIWLGAGLTYLALGVLTALLLTPLRLMPGTTDLSSILTGVAVLAACFTIFIEGVRVALSASHPLFAIARTVVAEAVRMKISLVFIIILIAWLASLPWLLDDSQPLRYRVQTFLRNGSSGAFWALALLTMFFSVATLSFEQRDKVVWSTVVKPVRAWHYVGGKWLGIMAVNAALLAVASSGVFLFTEYLRTQPATGEVEAYVNADGSSDPTRDRLILEARVLTARDVRNPHLPPLDVEAVEAELERIIEESMRTAPEDTPQARADVRKLFEKSTYEKAEAGRTAIAPLSYKDFVFKGLGEAKSLGRPITLRYKAQAGANDPTSIFALLFEFIDSESGQTIPFSVDTPLNIAQSVDLKPNVISDAGEVRIRVYNGDPERGLVNRYTVRFPPDGLRVYFVHGGYEANFVRIMSALWIKLGFIAAAGIFGATFLSFPVAAMFSFLVLFAAETSGFLEGSLGIYNSVGQEGEVLVHRVVIRAVALPIAYAFTAYRGLDSTHRLVDGELLSWGEFGGSALGLAILTGAILLCSVWVFKKRELAIYSGH